MSKCFKQSRLIILVVSNYLHTSTGGSNSSLSMPICGETLSRIFFKYIMTPGSEGPVCSLGFALCSRIGDFFLIIPPLKLGMQNLNGCLTINTCYNGLATLLLWFHSVNQVQLLGR